MEFDTLLTRRVKTGFRRNPFFIRFGSLLFLLYFFWSCFFFCSFLNSPVWCHFINFLQEVIAMKTKKASEIMTRPVVAVKENASARDVVLQLITGLFSGMPVTNDEGEVVGIITEMDILAAVDDGRELTRTTVKEIMTRDVARANPETTVEELIKILREFHLIRVPIVKDNRLVGIVSRSDILRCLIEPEFETYM
jgi:CBS domain-containing protein